ncbi:carbon-nitrogen family hydrolase [Acetobacterium tundrae]|nr:carbon-nitrogen family hydrolase [Acetobacterium tundrae]
MKIGAIQMKVALKKTEHNYNNAEVLLRKAAEAGVDVAVLPEMWSGGFLTEELEDQLADVDGQRTKAFLSRLAEELCINIVGGSVATKKGEKYFNTSYIANRAGDIIAEYDKTHLFSFGGEEKKYSPGDQLVTFQIDGVDCGIIICYEVRFPEWCRKQALAGSKILFVPAEWPLERVSHWRILNQARAIENQMFVICVNGCGEIVPNKFNAGNSMIINPRGEILADAGELPQEMIILSDVDISEVANTRNKMTIFHDRRADLY